MDSPPLYMVSVGPSPTSEDLVRAAVSMAREAGARLVAVGVATPAQAFWDSRTQGRWDHNLAVAEALGAEVVVLRSETVAPPLVEYARARGASRLIFGQNRSRGWKRLVRPSVTRDLRRLAGDLEVFELPSRPTAAPEEPEHRPWFKFSRKMFFQVLTVEAVSTVLAWGLREAGASSAVQVLCFVVGVVLSSGVWGLAAGLAASLVAVLIYNFAFTTPFYSFSVDDPWNWAVFALVGVVGAVVGTLTSRLEFRTLSLRNRERRLESLYRLGRAVSQAETKEEIQRVAEPHLASSQGVLREAMDILVASALVRVDRSREAQAALFLQALSHDLRTPLAVMNGAVRAVRGSADSRLSDRERLQLASLERETEELGRQLETMLELVRVSEQSLVGQFQWVPAEEILYSCRDSFASRQRPRPLVVQAIEALPLVRVEPGLLERAISNLVENADRYSPPGEPVELSFHLVGSDGEFRVSDRGPGVEADEQTKIFAKFYRGRAGRSEAGVRGTGLGLALVEEVAKVHGGSAGVRNRDGGGAEFWLRIPLGEGAPEVPS